MRIMLRTNRLLAAALFIVTIAIPLRAMAEPKVLHDSKSEFTRIIVEEDDWGVRRLYFEPDGAMQSAYDTKEPLRLVLPYARATMCGLGLVPKPQRMLIVGLGGASMPRFLHSLYPDAQIDVAELDPGVAAVAKRFFDFKEDAKMKVHIGDGRKFIETTENRYDIICLDAYGTDDIPYSLATREFLRAVRSKLSDGGIVVANVWGSLDNKLFPSMVKTYRDVFEEVHIIRATRSENRIFLVLPNKQGLNSRQIARRAAALKDKALVPLDLAAIVDAGYEANDNLPDSAKVLVDADKPK